MSEVGEEHCFLPEVGESCLGTRPGSPTLFGFAVLAQFQYLAFRGRCWPHLVVARFPFVAGLQGNRHSRSKSAQLRLVFLRLFLVLVLGKGRDALCDSVCVTGCARRKVQVAPTRFDVLLMFSLFQKRI